MVLINESPGYLTVFVLLRTNDNKIVISRYNILFYTVYASTDNTWLQTQV